MPDETSQRQRPEVSRESERPTQTLMLPDWLVWTLLPFAVIGIVVVAAGIAAFILLRYFQSHPDYS